MQQLLEHPLVAGSQEDLRLVLRAVPSARPPQARSGALGAGARADQDAAVKLNAPSGHHVQGPEFGMRAEVSPSV